MRLATVVATDYAECESLANLPAMVEDARAIYQRLSASDTELALSWLPGQRAFPEYLARLLATRNEQITAFVLYFSGYLAWRAGSTPALVLDAPRPRAFPLDRLCNLVAQRCASSLLILDVAFMGHEGDRVQVAQATREVLGSYRPWTGALLGIRPQHLAAGSSVFARVLLRALARLEGRADTVPFTDEDLCRSMHSELVPFLALVTWDYIPAERPFCLVPAMTQRTELAPPPLGELWERPLPSWDPLGNDASSWATDSIPPRASLPVPAAPAASVPPPQDQQVHSPETRGSAQDVTQPDPTSASPESSGSPAMKPMRIVAVEAASGSPEPPPGIPSSVLTPPTLVSAELSGAWQDTATRGVAPSSEPDRQALAPNTAAEWRMLVSKADELIGQRDWWGLADVYEMLLERAEGPVAQEIATKLSAIYRTELDDPRRAAFILERAAAGKAAVPSSLGSSEKHAETSTGFQGQGPASSTPITALSGSGAPYSHSQSAAYPGPDTVSGVAPSVPPTTRAPESRASLGPAPDTTPGPLSEEGAVVPEPPPTKAEEWKALVSKAAGLMAARDWWGVASVYEVLLTRAEGSVAHEIAGKLAAIYRNELEDPWRATYILERAVAVDGGSPALWFQLSDICAGTNQMDQAVEHWVGGIRRDPHDVEPYRRARALFELTGQTDRAWNSASVLKLAGSAVEAEARFADEHRSEGLLPAKATLADEQWRQGLFQPERFPVLEGVLGLVSPAAISHRLTMLTRGKKLPPLDPGLRQDPKQSTTTLCRSLTWTARLLGLPAPELYVYASEEAKMSAAPAASPTTLVSRAFATGLSLPELAFLWGRHLTYFRPEYYLLVFYSTVRDLASVLVAASLAPTWDPGKARVHAKAIKKLAGHLHQSLKPADLLELGELTRELNRNDPRQQMLRWVQSIDLTANRAGLLACGDIGVAAATLQRFPVSSTQPVREHVGDLMQYALSRGYSELRSHLGVAVTG